MYKSCEIYPKQILITAIDNSIYYFKNRLNYRKLLSQYSFFSATKMIKIGKEEIKKMSAIWLFCHTILFCEYFLFFKGVKYRFLNDEQSKKESINEKFLYNLALKI